MPEANIHVDAPMRRIASYLMEWLNREYARKYPAADGEPQQRIVQAIRDTSAFNAPYDQYPLLKCYRLFEDGTLGGQKDNVTMTITYGLAYPDQQNLSPLLAWVKREIKAALSTWVMENPGCPPVMEPDTRYRAEYRTIVNELTLKVYEFLRITINVVDY